MKSRGSEHEKQPDDGKLEDKSKNVKRHWWHRLPQAEKDKVISREFERAHPSNEEKKKATRRYESGM